MDPISSQIQIHSQTTGGETRAVNVSDSIHDGDVKMIRELKLREASQNLEASFLTQLVQAMEKTVPKNSLAGSDNTLSTMMFGSTMGEALAKASPTGLSEMFYQALAEKDGALPVDMKFDNLDIQGIHSLKMDILKETF